MVHFRIVRLHMEHYGGYIKMQVIKELINSIWLEPIANSDFELYWILI